MKKTFAFLIFTNIAVSCFAQNASGLTSLADYELIDREVLTDTKPLHKSVSTENKTNFYYKKGQTLEQVFQVWATQAGWSFYWNFPQNFPEIVFEQDYKLPDEVKSVTQAYTHVVKALNWSDKVSVKLYNGNNSIVVSPK